MRRSEARSARVALRRVAASDRRARAARLRFLGDVRAAIAHDDVTYSDVAEVLGVGVPGVVKLRHTAERDGAIS